MSDAMARPGAEIVRALGIGDRGESHCISTAGNIGSGTTGYNL